MLPRTPFRVFIVSGDSFSMPIYEKYLHNQGHWNVISLSSSQACIESLPVMPDLVLIDQGHVEGNGIDLIQKIKEFNTDIYVVTLSSGVNIEPALEAIRTGAFDYIIKGESESKRLEEVIERINYLKKALYTRGRSMPKLNKVMFSLLLILFSQITFAFSGTMTDTTQTLEKKTVELTIMGKVNNPGKYKLDNQRISLYDLLSKANGFDDQANLGSIKVLRQQESGVKMESVILPSNDAALLKSIRLQPGDVVVIPSSTAWNFDKQAADLVPRASNLTSASVLLNHLIQ